MWIFSGVSPSDWDQKVQDRSANEVYRYPHKHKYNNPCMDTLFSWKHQCFHSTVRQASEQYLSYWNDSCIDNEFVLYPQLLELQNECIDLLHPQTYFCIPFSSHISLRL